MSEQVDPYKGFRDDRGRFTKGNPGSKGRPEKTFTWLSENEFKRKYKFLNIIKPGACPDCGGVEHRFNIRWDEKKAYSICARCNNCNERRWYSQYNNSWSSSPI